MLAARHDDIYIYMLYYGKEKIHCEIKLIDY